MLPPMTAPPSGSAAVRTHLVDGPPGRANPPLPSVPLVAITDTEALVDRGLLPLVASGGPW
jgi:hypothetical protein